MAQVFSLSLISETNSQFSADSCQFSLSLFHIECLCGEVFLLETFWERRDFCSSIFMNICTGETFCVVVFFLLLLLRETFKTARLCLFLGVSRHPRVRSSLPVRCRASSLSLVTVTGSRVGTSGLTAGSWYALAGAAKLRLLRATLTPKAASPSPRASAVWTIDCLSTSPQVKPSPVRRAKARRSSRRNRGSSPPEMD